LAKQFDAFTPEHRVLSVDLRGHGKSGKPKGVYSIEAFSDDVAWLCRERRIDKAIIVGHSMGGTIALDLAARHPSLVLGIVMLEALVVTPPPIIDGFRPVLEGLRGPQYAGVMRQFQGQLFGPHFDAREKEALLDRFCASEKEPMISALEHVLSYDSASAAKACKVPALYVATGPWYTDVARFKELCPTFVTSQTIGSGHHLQIEVPAQVNAMIQRFIEVHVRDAS
jgi:pimeloyl-ACP methyl ester carboxylesterase